MKPISRIYLDTNIFITLIEKSDVTQRLLVDLLTKQPLGERPLFATSELTLSELLVKPYRQKDEMLMMQYDSLILSNEWLDVRSVDRGVLYYASVLRAQHNHLKLPDAIHLSSAIGQGCSHLLTNDLGIKDQYIVDHERHGVHGGPVSVSVIRPDEFTLTSLIESLPA
ncbi:hypothetical protein ACO34A_01410 [Rhizobium sp. ACO-34A]|nr:PIN domain-containing protein [Rhizobium sp. ACO-34A]ATN32468.1 hypothetical protein ACO34A_01410 [Rhizobium sp. ACO-34A]